MVKKIKEFFANSETLDYMSLRQLSHISLNWELFWNHGKKEYVREDGSFASLLNDLINEMANTTPPAKYHDNEDVLAQYVIDELKWKIEKVGNRWVGDSYESILEQGGFNDIDEKNLVLAATGRVKAAIENGQLHFDEMEEGHQNILAGVIAIILYHRYNMSCSLLLTAANKD
ncbi:hypothetical protein MD537_00770 [Flavihumibacter sediminis]|nr:hypothetical protein [Flavihumibacter sediminis]